jgi:hypothetical protein
MTRATPGWSRRLTAAVACLALLVAPWAIRPARADDTIARARARYSRGEQLFDAGNYRGAITEFSAAEKLAPSPINGFNIALCHERLGEVDQALAGYRAYLRALPDASNRAAVEARIQALEARRDAQPAATAKTGPANERARETSPKAPPRASGDDDAAAATRPDDAAEAAPEPPAADSPDDGADAASAAPAEPATARDPELQRVASIDVGSVRDQRRRLGFVAGAPAAGGEATPPAPADAADTEEASSPVYKEWWFWAVMGVSAIIFIDILTPEDQGGSDVAPTRPGARSGPVLLRF